MALDIDAIKRKIAELNGERSGGSNFKYLTLNEGETRVRALPWRTGVKEGEPILERHFYKFGTSKRVLAPFQFNLPDPIHDYVISLYKKKTPEDKEIANKLRAKMTGYLPVVERGKEGEGCVVWSFTPFVYKRVLGFWVDEEIGDVTDPKEGFDLKISLVPNGKFWQGKKQFDTVVDPARKSTPLMADEAAAQKLLDSVPDVDGNLRKFCTRTPAELEQMLHEWINSDKEDDGSDGTAKGGETSVNELDKLADDINAKPAKKEKPVEESLEEETPKKSTKSSKQALDDAFAELEEE